MRRCKGLIWAFAAVLSACTTGVETAADIDMSLDRDFLESVRMKAEVPQRVIRSSTLTVLSRNVGNLGAITKLTAEAQYHLEAEGLVLEDVAFTDGRGGWTVRQQALCGLFALRSEYQTDSRSTGAGTVALNTGTTTLPVKASGLFMRRRYAVRSASLELKECSPTPGAVLSARFSSEGQATLEGTILKSNRITQLAVEMRCEVGDSTEQASSIHPSLTGLFVRVRCTTKGGGDFVAETGVYAYLLDQQRYLPLVLKQGAITDTYEYRQISFR